MTLGQLITRYPQSRFIDMLALEATFGRYDANGLLTAKDPAAIGATDPKQLMIFAWVSALLDPSPDNLRRSLGFFEKAFPDLTGGLNAAVWGTFAKTLYASGGLEEAQHAGLWRDNPGLLERLKRRVPENVWWAIETDRLNPFLGSSSADYSAWLDHFNQPFTAQGLAPILLTSEEAASPFDRLSVKAVSEEAKGELISIVMPTYNPGPSIINSAASILSQTYRNIELVVVDDASTQGHDYIDQISKSDPRVRVIRHPENRGAYTARNTGLLAAGGKFATFQDDDDYSHPQRLAILHEQIAHREIVGIVGKSIRVRDTLQLTIVGSNTFPTNLSSLLFRRDPVIQQLGGYDPVRRAADTEFVDRIRAVFGPDSVPISDSVVGFIQLTPQSLSRGEMGEARRHPARMVYREAARAWHATRKPTSDDALRVQTPERAPFPAPVHIAGGELDELRFDVAVLGPTKASLGYDIAPICNAFLLSQLNVGVKEFVGPKAVRSAYHKQAFTLGPLLLPEAKRVKTVSIRLPGEAIVAPSTLIYGPLAVITMPPDSLSEVRTERVFLIADEWYSFEQLSAIESILREQVSTHIVWIPTGTGIKEYLNRSPVKGRVADPVTTYISQATQVGRRHDWTYAVIGAVAPSLCPSHWDAIDSGSWHSVPHRANLPSDPKNPIWIFGDRRGAELAEDGASVESSHRNWPEFVRQVDILLAMSRTGTEEHILQAWDSETLVVAPESVRGVLGERALYLGIASRPDTFPSLDELLAALVRNPAPAAAAIEAGREYCRVEFSRERLAESLSLLHEVVHETA